MASEEGLAMRQFTGEDQSHEMANTKSIKLPPTIDVALRNIKDAKVILESMLQGFISLIYRVDQKGFSLFNIFYRC